jgi:hypothetical protein
MRISSFERGRNVSLGEAATWFVSISSTIFIVFERVEKFSSKADLELYYLILTVKRTAFDRPWHMAVSRFFDKIFGRGNQLRIIYFPSFFRTFAFTSVVTGCISVFIITQDGLWHIKGEGTAFIIAYMISIALDYIVFAKTRTILRMSSANHTIIRHLYTYY